MTAWLIYFFGSGAAFFAGIGLVLVATAVFSICQHKWAARTVTLGAFIGLILVALSAYPSALLVLWHSRCGFASLADCGTIRAKDFTQWPVLGPPDGHFSLVCRHVDGDSVSFGTHLEARRSPDALHFRRFGHRWDGRNLN
ncbi:MAG TPA: hypothetical protein VGX70_10885 [Gemmataceae bacterium]|jgi:hypothetical protein|nr:hypothetical protein [Gemmataceae bacterium]